MKKKVFLISGSNSGIGYSITKKLIKNKNYKVIGISKGKSKIKAKNFNFIRFDLSDNNFDILFDKISKISKEIDCFINNAGISIINKKYKDFENTFKVNLFAGYKICRHLADLNKKKNRKLILIHIGSISGKQALPNNIAYNSSKAALSMMSSSFALDYAKYKLRSNTIILGYFPTNMTKKTFNSKKRQTNKIKRTMLGRLGSLKEIFDTIEFLSSEKSSYITGQEIIIDGGWTSKGL